MSPSLRSPSRALRALCAGLAACALPAAHADCVDGVREARPAESTFQERAMAALVAALPPVPRGAEATGMRYDFKQLPGLGVLCTDTKVGDFSPNVRRDYQTSSATPQRAWVILRINSTKLPDGSATVPAGSYGQASPRRSASLRVVNVVWVIRGEPGPLRDALEASLDKARLKGLVDKPLPTVGESQAAAQAAEASGAAAVVAPSSAAAPIAASAAAHAPAQDTQAPAPATVSNAAAPVSAAGPAPLDPLKGAADAAQKLRGLFGR